MKEFRQVNEYSCGVYALRYLLYLKGIVLKPTEKDLKTTANDGTDPKNICAYLNKNKINFEEHKGEDPAILVNTNWIAPFIVNYQWDGDGHYGVITQTGPALKIWNPYTSNHNTWALEDFIPKWYSNRYGKQWALKIL